MKKTIVGALVGGIIIFILQFLSWTVLNLHHKSQEYTPKQDSILAYLNSQELHSGAYFMPSLPPGYSMDAMNKLTNASKGKPWAVISYHRSMDTNMGKDMALAFLVDVIAVALLAWILLKITLPSFGTIFLASLFVGAIVYLNQPLTYHIWYETPGQLGYIIDAAAQWGITGIWLGWWLRRK